MTGKERESPEVNPSRLRDIGKLNQRLREAPYLYENLDLLDEMRRLPNPILVDSDYLVNPTPDVKKMMEELKKVGTVVIFTKNWEQTHQSLLKSGLWDDNQQDTILLPQSNYDQYSLKDYGSNVERSQFLDRMQHWAYDMFLKQRPDLSELFQQWGSAAWLAPVFSKSYNIPIIIPYNIFINSLGLTTIAVGGKDNHRPSQIVEITKEVFNHPDMNVILIIPPSQAEPEAVATALKRLQDCGINIAPTTVIPITTTDALASCLLLQEKIFGQSFERKWQNSGGAEEDQTLLAQAESLYSQLAGFYLGIFQNGGSYFRYLHSWFLASNGYFFSGQSKGGTETKLLFAPQTTLHVDTAKPNDPQIIKQLEFLLKGLEEHENSLGTTFNIARSHIIDLLQVPLNVPFALRQSILTLRSRLGDQEATTIIAKFPDEIAVAKQKYLSLVENLSLSGAEINRLMAQFLESEQNNLKEVLKDKTDQKDGIDIFMRGFQAFWNKHLREAIGRRLEIPEAETTKALIDRYGAEKGQEISYMINDAIFSRAKQITKEVIDPQMDRLISRMVKLFGWEDNLLPHLDVICQMVANERTQLRYYLPMVLEQLGWDYQLSYNPQELDRLTGTIPKSQTRGRVKHRGSIENLISSNIANQPKVGEIRQIYGEAVADRLINLLTAREIKKLGKKHLG